MLHLREVDILFSCNNCVRPKIFEACDDARFVRNVFPRQFRHTIHGTHLAAYGYASSCREHSHPRNDHTSEPKRFIRGNTKIGSILEVTIAKHFDRHGIEIKIDFMQKHGTQSWIVISRGIGSFESKGGGNLSIHYNGDSTTAELLFRIIISFNQLSVYGAILDWCEELSQQISDHSFSSTILSRDEYE